MSRGRPADRPEHFRRHARARCKSRFSTSYTLTQDDLDDAGNAGGDNDIDNTATADSRSDWRAWSSTGRNAARLQSSLAIDREAFFDVNGNVSEQANSVGDVSLPVSIENTGNVTLTGVSVVDRFDRPECVRCHARAPVPPSFNRAIGHRGRSSWRR